MAAAAPLPPSSSTAGGRLPGEGGPRGGERAPQGSSGAATPTTGSSDDGSEEEEEETSPEASAANAEAAAASARGASNERAPCLGNKTLLPLPLPSVSAADEEPPRGYPKLREARRGPVGRHVGPAAGGDEERHGVVGDGRREERGGLAVKAAAPAPTAPRCRPRDHHSDDAVRPTVVDDEAAAGDEEGATLEGRGGVAGAGVESFFFLRG